MLLMKWLRSLPVPPVAEPNGNPKAMRRPNSNAIHDAPASAAAAGATGVVTTP